MKWDIICKINEKDNYLPEYIDKEHFIEIPLIENNSSYKPVWYTIFKIFRKKNLYLQDKIVDLINLSLAVYTADKLILREKAFDTWSRYFILHLPVINVPLWISLKENLETMLSFLSGDKWKIKLRERKNLNVKGEQREFALESDITKVCM
ncbi:MAG: hypothetical protein ABRQ39_27470, partial [Candidatus Eremiobacterota bacterium]